MEQIRFLTSRDKDEVEQMKQIWRECFEAEDAYLNLYFSLLYCPEQTLVYQQDGQVLGMLTLLPCRYRVGERTLNARYLFAVATLPDAQGRQISTKLLAHADREMQRQGTEVALLAPATAQLYDFYGKRGYTPWFAGRKQSFAPLGTPVNFGEISLQPLSEKEYLLERERFAPRNAVVWGERHLRFARWESELYHGGLYRLVQGETTLGICNLYRYSDSEVIVKELLTEQGRKERDFIQFLRAFFYRCSTVFRLSAEGEGELSPVGMVRFYREEEFLQDTEQEYLSFLLD